MDWILILGIGILLVIFITGFVSYRINMQAFRKARRESFESHLAARGYSEKEIVEAMKDRGF